MGLRGLEPRTSSLSRCRQDSLDAAIAALTWPLAVTWRHDCPGIYPGCVERSRAGVGPALGSDRYCRLCRSATSLRSWALKKHEDRPASPCGGRCICDDGCRAAGCVRKQQTVVVRDRGDELRASCPGAGRRAHNVPRELRRKPRPSSPEGARARGPGDRRSRDRRRHRPGREPAGSALPGPRSSRPSVLLPGAVGPDQATERYQAIRPGHAALIAQTSCTAISHGKILDVAGSCPLIEVTVVP